MKTCNEIEVIKSAIEEHEAEIKAKDEEIAKLEQQNGFSDIYIQDLETQIKAKDERIKELEEALKPKTCDGCVYFRDDRHCWIENINNYLTCKRHTFELPMVDRYEPKDKE